MYITYILHYNPVLSLWKVLVLEDHRGPIYKSLSLSSNVKSLSLSSDHKSMSLSLKSLSSDLKSLTPSLVVLNYVYLCIQFARSLCNSLLCRRYISGILTLHSICLSCPVVYWQVTTQE